MLFYLKLTPVLWLFHFLNPLMRCDSLQDVTLFKDFRSCSWVWIVQKLVLLSYSSKQCNKIIYFFFFLLKVTKSNFQQKVFKIQFRCLPKLKKLTVNIFYNLLLYFIVHLPLRKSILRRVLPFFSTSTCIL